jgi:hypothetical protein
LFFGLETIQYGILFLMIVVKTLDFWNNSWWFTGLLFYLRMALLFGSTDVLKVLSIAVVTSLLPKNVGTFPFALTRYLSNNKVWFWIRSLKCGVVIITKPITVFGWWFINQKPNNNLLSIYRLASAIQCRFEFGVKEVVKNCIFEWISNDLLQLNSTGVVRIPILFFSSSFTIAVIANSIF